MERHELMALMAELSLAGMRAAYDEVMSDGLKLSVPIGYWPIRILGARQMSVGRRVST